MAAPAFISSVTFGGINLESRFNVKSDQSQIFKIPERDYETIEIPGRNGDLLVSNNRFKNITISVDCFLRSDFPGIYRSVIAALIKKEGYQRLVFPQDPDHYRMAFLQTAIEPETGSFNESGGFTLVFNCKPQRFRNDGDVPQEFPNGNTVSGGVVTNQGVTITEIENTGSYDAKPLIRFFGNGYIIVQGRKLTIRGINDFVDIDCDLMTCMTEGVNMAQHVIVETEYPIIEPGIQEIEYSTDSTNEIAVKITPRWFDL